MENYPQTKNHKRKITAAVTATLVTALLITATLAAQARPLKPGIDFSGPHFNLNIHGVLTPDKFENDSIGSGRHTIFVPVSTYDENGDPYNISIQYAFSYDLNWTVLDCDATDDGTASIILPAYMYLDTNADGVEDTKTRVRYYMVYLAGLGKPLENSFVIISPTAAYNETSWTAFQLNQNSLTVNGHRKGAPVWYNGTELFFADVTYSNVTGIFEYVDQWIFDIPELEGYWWQMTNSGVKLMQVRFYPVFA